MKPLFITFLIFLSSCSYLKRKHYFVIQIDSTTKIVFTDIEYVNGFNNEIDTFFCGPLILKDDDTLGIYYYTIGYISEFCGFTGEYDISPNKQYILIFRLEEGWIVNTNDNGQLDSFFHDQFFCCLIDIKNKELLDEFQAGCGGEWNEDGEWITPEELYKDTYKRK